MAAENRNDELMLNAMVDGELAPAERAAVAARLADERDLARAYATLSKLKATLVASAGETGSGIDVTLPVRARGRRMMVAASIVLMACAGLLMAMIWGQPVRMPLAETKISPVEQVQRIAFPIEPVIPDLVPAGLRLAKTVVSADAKSPVVVATYLGPRGCKLELTVRSGDAIATNMAGTDRRKWHVGGLTYELVAYGMPAARFSIVAEAAERATRVTSQPDVINGRLREARISPLPCIA